MGKNTLMWRCFVGIAVAAAIGSSSAFAQDTASDEESSESEIEEVIVLGIRASLESALAAKRERANLTEIINADDIGKLPDENVAEVLENIPGVQITRDAGIGEDVSIRGSNQNRVEINGRTTTPSGSNRGGISFSDLPAALVKSLEVVKVPTADMVEGSLGGTIDVKTYRGLSLKKPLRSVRGASEYAENADVWNENFAATLGDKFSTERVMLVLFLPYLILTKLCGRIVFAFPRGFELQTKVKLILMVMAKAMHIISLALVI
jgi:outer membrane cobalamin receptor